MKDLKGKVLIRGLFSVQAIEISCKRPRKFNWDLAILKGSMRRLIFEPLSLTHELQITLVYSNLSLLLSAQIYIKIYKNNQIEILIIENKFSIFSCLFAFFRSEKDKCLILLTLLIVVGIMIITLFILFGFFLFRRYSWRPLPNGHAL